jgi:hypothetical protein
VIFVMMILGHLTIILQIFSCFDCKVLTYSFYTAYVTINFSTGTNQLIVDTYFYR